MTATLGPGDFFGEAAILETQPHGNRHGNVARHGARDVRADLAVLNAQSPSVHAAIERAMAERLPDRSSERSDQYAPRMSTTNTSVSVPVMPAAVARAAVALVGGITTGPATRWLTDESCSNPGITTFPAPVVMSPGAPRSHVESNFPLSQTRP